VSALAFIQKESVKHPPIKFDLLTADWVMRWMVDIREKAAAQGIHLSFGSYGQNRAALNHLFRSYRHEMSLQLAGELAVHFRGLKRETALSVGQGRGRVQTGKDPMSFTLYKRLCRFYLKSEKREYVFTRTFMVMCWNLMCRSANAVSICLSHMEWRGDALGIYFAHMKNDQSGERPRDARHVYANPICPEICPILSLGLYFLCYPFAENYLFPGGKQYDRYRQNLSKVLRQEELQDELEMWGISPEDIGTHSTRKGAASYCTSGSTAGPSNAAVHLRAGWSMGAVQNTYLRYVYDRIVWVNVW
jgi:hypothetical protein